MTLKCCWASKKQKTQQPLSVDLRKSCQQFKYKLTLFSSLQAEAHQVYKT